MIEAPKDASEKNAVARRSLKDALYIVRDRQADRDDVVADAQATAQARLQLLAEELQPVIDDVDNSDERFEFALSRGERPRLWIDATSHVQVGSDRRTLRFLKDTRLGRTVLAESSDLGKMADNVSHYIAEKVIERERDLEGDWIALKSDANSADGAKILIKDDVIEDDALELGADDTIVSTTSNTEKSAKGRNFGRSAMTFIFGVAVTLAAVIVAAFFLAPQLFSQ